MSDLSTDPVYDAAVDLIITSGSDELIDNENYKHARSLIRALIGKQKAEKFIGIFTEKLDSQGFAPRETLDAFRDQLKRGIELRILFQIPPDIDIFHENQFYVELMKDGKYRKLIKTRVLKDNHNEIDMHIITPNSKAFRVETDHANTKALASFNNDLGKDIREKFNQLFSDEFSRELQLV